MKKKEEKFVDVELRTDPEVDKLLRDGAARAGVTPEELAKSILIAKLAEPERPVKPIEDTALLILDRRVQELVLTALLTSSDQLLRDIETYENRLKHYGHTPTWSGKDVYLGASRKMQSLAKIVPILCNVLNKADALGGLLEWHMDVRRKETL